MPGPPVSATPDDFRHARPNGLATGVILVLRLSHTFAVLLFTYTFCHTCPRGSASESSHIICFDFTRLSIELGINEIADGCVKGIGSGVHGTRPGWMTGCE